VLLRPAEKRKPPDAGGLRARIVRHATDGGNRTGRLREGSLGMHFPAARKSTRKRLELVALDSHCIECQEKTGTGEFWKRLAQLTISWRAGRRHPAAFVFQRGRQKQRPPRSSGVHDDRAFRSAPDDGWSFFPAAGQLYPTNAGFFNLVLDSKTVIPQR